MLYEFKCRATGTVVMTQPVAERLLAIVGKPPGATGIFTCEQLPAAITALDAAVAAERARGNPTEDAAADDADPQHQPAVSLGQRAWPLIDMMKTALKARREITWGA